MSDTTDISLFILMIITILYVIHREDRLIKSVELAEQKILENVVKQFACQQIDVTSILAQQHVEYINESANEIKALVLSVEKLNSSVENVFAETSKVELAVSKVTNEVSNVTNEVIKVTDGVKQVVGSVKDVKSAVVDLRQEYKGRHP